jgi:hypothetical protein
MAEGEEGEGKRRQSPCRRDAEMRAQRRRDEVMSADRGKTGMDRYP